MVRRGSTVRVRQRALRFFLLEAVSVVGVDDGRGFPRPRSVHRVDVDRARGIAEGVEQPDRMLTAVSVAA
jgi:hypothetical protein